MVDGCGVRAGKEIDTREMRSRSSATAPVIRDAPGNSDKINIIQLHTA